MATALAIIDSGGANLASVRFAFERLGVQATVTRSAVEILSAERVILPGVGHISACMRSLREAGLDQVVPQVTAPLLGICVGLQMLALSSDEAEESDPRSTQYSGLGVFPSPVRRLDARRVPHMGWSRVTANQDNPHALLQGLDGAWFYFVHSYALGRDEAHVIAASEHETAFAAAVARDNFAAVQFHPELSAQSGAQLLQNFLSWQP